LKPPLLRNLLPDPDALGQSEYRAIYDCIMASWPDIDEDYETDKEKISHVIDMLDEFSTWADNLKKDMIQARYGMD
jgi:hypothetical protein